MLSAGHTVSRHVHHTIAKEVLPQPNQTFYPAATVAIKLLPALALPNHVLHPTNQCRVRSNFLCKLVSPDSRPDIESRLPLTCLPGENCGFAAMPFTCPARALQLGLTIIGKIHSIYETGKVIFDNACFPPGSRAAFVRLITVNCE